ncbi:beta-glucosidase G [Aspergillus keveii]|uniref:Probable beta-glucosidase G n=1 Tax=Aspergillus keveii TaxID=714993 RepID=A0ABR4FY95_9EURO
MHWTGAAAVISALLQASCASRDVFSDPGINVDKWHSATRKANALITQLNITEKAGLLTGNLLNLTCGGIINAIPRVDFPGLCLQDGPAGIRTADLASVFTAGISIGATWDPELIYERGRALGEEFRGKGAHVILGPATGPLGRIPLGGRNWEGFSVDPYLAGIATSATVRGIQDSGVQACTKHYVGNEQETQRTLGLAKGVSVDAISSNIDDRTLHELYIWPFADAVRAGTLSIMCSYNRLNSTYACEDDHTLNGILKEELGFKGYVMSDWFATHSGAKAANAGLDMNMPGPVDQYNFTNSYFGPNLVRAVQSGNVSAERLDDMVRRVLTPYFYLGQDKDYPTIDPSGLFVTLAALSYSPSAFSIPDDTPLPPARDVRADHAALIRNHGAAGTVLLKNTKHTLPLKAPRTIAVFGNDAADLSRGSAVPLGAAYAPPQGVPMGVQVMGGGAGSGRLSYVVSPLEALRARAASSNHSMSIQYVTDNSVVANADFSGIYPFPDVCLVFLKTYAAETIDRTSFEADWNSTAVVNSVASYCPSRKTVVVTHSAGINTMPWADNPNVTAILAAHYPGQEAGNSIVDILFGDVNPSGHLPYTIARNETDYNTEVFNVTDPAQVTDAAAWQSDFTEGLLIDYRHFDANAITPLYEFGFGLSYTIFELTGKVNVRPVHGQRTISVFPPKVKENSPGGNPNLWKTLFAVTVKVRNTGDVAGSAVPQLYLSQPRSTVPAGTPMKVLRGFDKVYLKAGEERNVSFPLMRRDMSFWDVGASDWRLPRGEYIVRVGFSSRDIRMEGTIRV